MLNVSNLLSFLRMPLAFLFLQKNTFLRVTAIVLAMASDIFDGYLARRNNTTTKLGAILDPAMDKFFVYFVLFIFYLENTVQLTEAAALLSRDIAICIYGLYLLLTNKWAGLKIKPLCFGKITTALQFLVLIGLTLHYQFSYYIYSLFMILGFLALIELFFRKNGHLKNPKIN